VRASRLLGLLAAVATAVLIAPAPALAEPYPAEPPASSISEAEVADGGTVTFRGEGFLPGETIAITINYGGSDSNAAARATAGRFVPAAMPLRRQADLTVTASSAGTFSVTLKLTEVGSATLVATGLTSGVTVTQTVEVVAPSEHDDGASGGGGGDDEDTTTAGGGGNNLPTTGSSGRVLFISLYAGLGAVRVGAALLWLTRSRRRSAD
jgi:hypothetical protein